VQARHVEQHAAAGDPVARRHDVVLQRADALHVARGKPLYIVSSTNTWQSASMCEVAMPWNEMPMKSSAGLETRAERRARVARDDHVVQRGRSGSRSTARPGSRASSSP
jgi:hypothetical protein